MRIEGNIAIGSIEGLNEQENIILKDRSELSIPAAPFVPPLTY